MQQGDITYYISCQVTLVDAANDPTFAVVDSGDATAQNLDGSSIDAGTELTAGTTFKFEIDLNPTDVAATDGTPGADGSLDAGDLRPQPLRDATPRQEPARNSSSG